jgi:hypothetical protein
MPIQIDVIYGHDAATTYLDVRIMKFDRAVVGQEFTTPLDGLDMFIYQVRDAIDGAGVTEDGPFLSIQRKADWIIFGAPTNAARTPPIMMRVADATAMVDQLDAVNDAIYMLLGAGVKFIESGDTPTPELEFIKDGEPTTEAAALARVAANLLNGKISGATDIR